MRTKKKPQADLDRGFESGNFLVFDYKFQRFCHRPSILTVRKKT